MKGQAAAVSLVMGCGLAMLIMSRSLIHSLESTRQEYYEAHRFAEVFAHLKRAPNALAARLAEVPGVGTAQAGVAVQVTQDLLALSQMGLAPEEALVDPLLVADDVVKELDDPELDASMR